MRFATDRIAYARYTALRKIRLIHQDFLADQHFCKHISAPDRARRCGGNDRYYGRKFQPKVLISRMGKTRDPYTPTEINAYAEGYQNESERKDWR